MVGEKYGEKWIDMGTTIGQDTLHTRKLPVTYSLDTCRSMAPSSCADSSFLYSSNISKFMRFYLISLACNAVHILPPFYNCFKKSLLSCFTCQRGRDLPMLYPSLPLAAESLFILCIYHFNFSAF